MAIPTLNTLSLFSGYGGLELGLALAGEVCGFETRTVCYVEREAYAAANLVSKMAAAQLDQAPIWSDVTTFDPEPWRGRVDLITGGFPCQPWSAAGKRAGTADERWLWPDIARLVRVIRPGLVFLENVPGLLAGGIEHVLGDLAALGYDAEWEVFSAEQLGATHERERVFILAYTARERHEWCRGARGRRNGPANKSEKLVNAGGSGLNGHQFNAGPGQRGSITAERCKEVGYPTGGGCKQSDKHPENRRGSSQPQSASTWPPDPENDYLWAEIISRWPEVEPAICGLADGVADRVDRIWSGGLGVVPVVAGYAFCTLARRAGLVAL